MRSDFARLPLTLPAKRGCRGANAAAVDTNARRSAEGAIISGATPPRSRIGRGCVAYQTKTEIVLQGNTRTHGLEVMEAPPEVEEGLHDFWTIHKTRLDTSRY